MQSNQCEEEFIVKFSKDGDMKTKMRCKREATKQCDGCKRYICNKCLLIIRKEEIKCDSCAYDESVKKKTELE